MGYICSFQVVCPDLRLRHEPQLVSCRFSLSLSLHCTPTGQCCYRKDRFKWLLVARVCPLFYVNGRYSIRRVEPVRVSLFLRHGLYLGSYLPGFNPTPPDFSLPNSHPTIIVKTDSSVYSLPDQSLVDCTTRVAQTILRAPPFRDVKKCDKYCGFLYACIFLEKDICPKL